MADYSIKLSKTKEMERLVDLEVDSQSPLASIYGRTKGRLRSRLAQIYLISSPKTNDVLKNCISRPIKQRTTPKSTSESTRQVDL